MPAFHSLHCRAAEQCQLQPGSGNPTRQSNVPIAATSLRYVRSCRLHSPTSPSLAAPEAVSSTLELCSGGRGRAINRQAGGAAHKRHRTRPSTLRGDASRQQWQPGEAAVA